MRRFLGRRLTLLYESLGPFGGFLLLCGGEVVFAEF